MIDLARKDRRITGIALTGSAALGDENRWSDIDLALGVSEESGLNEVLESWTRTMYDAHGALHHTDVRAGESIYRVFLLKSTLQVDLAFSPSHAFRATGPSFKLVDGVAVEPHPLLLPTVEELVGLGWLYALHARASIERQKVWQAEYMISGMRDQVLALYCLRYGVSPYQGRGVDAVPTDATDAVRSALVHGLDVSELQRAFGTATECLLAEIRLVDVMLADRLAGALEELAAPSSSDD